MGYNVGGLLQAKKWKQSSKSRKRFRLSEQPATGTDWQSCER